MCINQVHTDTKYTDTLHIMETNYDNSRNQRFSEGIYCTENDHSTTKVTNTTNNTSQTNTSNHHQNHPFSRGKTLMILCIAIILAAAIFVSLIAVILYNYFNIDEFDNFQINSDPLSPNSQDNFPILPTKLSNSPKIKVLPTKISFSNTTTILPTTTSPKTPFTPLEFNFSKLQKLKNCEATSFTSFSTHNRDFLVTAETHTDQVKIHEYIKQSSEFATIQVIFIRNPIDVKFLPEIKCLECAMLMIITESEVSFYKFSENDRSFVLESSTRRQGELKSIK